VGVKAARIAVALVLKEFKNGAMKNYNRDLLLLYNVDMVSEDLLQFQVECLHQILAKVESEDVFCKAHELASRHKITSKPKAITKAIADTQLKPFYFLINKN
jgi:hypothetical protein